MLITNIVNWSRMCWLLVDSLLAFKMRNKLGRFSGSEPAQEEAQQPDMDETELLARYPLGVRCEITGRQPSSTTYTRLEGSTVRGTVRFVGPVSFNHKFPFWIGVELDEPVECPSSSLSSDGVLELILFLIFSPCGGTSCRRERMMARWRDIVTLLAHPLAASSSSLIGSPLAISLPSTFLMRRRFKSFPFSDRNLGFSPCKISLLSMRHHVKEGRTPGARTPSFHFIHATNSSSLFLFIQFTLPARCTRETNTQQNGKRLVPCSAAQMVTVL